MGSEMCIRDRLVRQTDDTLWNPFHPSGADIRLTASLRAGNHRIRGPAPAFQEHDPEAVIRIVQNEVSGGRLR